MWIDARSWLGCFKSDNKNETIHISGVRAKETQRAVDVREGGWHVSGTKTERWDAKRRNRKRRRAQFTTQGMTSSSGSISTTPTCFPTTFTLSLWKLQQQDTPLSQHRTWKSADSPVHSIFLLFSSLLFCMESRMQKMRRTLSWQLPTHSLPFSLSLSLVKSTAPGLFETINLRSILLGHLYIALSYTLLYMLSFTFFPYTDRIYFGTLSI